MKRDLDLCREILQRLRDHPDALHPKPPKIEGRSHTEVSHHLEIMAEAGLVWSQYADLAKQLVGADLATRSSFATTMAQAPHLEAYRLTWAGYEFLDAAENDTLWNEAKHEVGSRLGSIPFELVQAVLVDLGRKLVGLG